MDKKEKEIVELKAELKLLNELSKELDKKIRDVKTELEKRGVIKFYDKGDVIHKIGRDEYGNYEVKWEAIVRAKKCEAILFVEDMSTGEVKKVNANDSSIVKKNCQEV